MAVACSSGRRADGARQLRQEKKQRRSLSPPQQDALSNILRALVALRFCSCFTCLLALTPSQSLKGQLDMITTIDDALVNEFVSTLAMQVAFSLAR